MATCPGCGAPTAPDERFCATCGAELNVEVDDVDAEYARLVAAGLVFEGPPADQPWGARHAWPRDLDGRRLSLLSGARG